MPFAQVNSADTGLIIADDADATTNIA